MTGEQRTLTPSGGISITRLQVPLTLTVGIVLVLLGGVTSFALVWYKTSAHAEDNQTHVDQHDAMSGGGLAYKNDVSSLSTAFERKMVDEQKKTRKLLRAMEINCRSRNGGLACTVTLPEGD